MARKGLFMLFPKGIDRAFELQSEQNGHDQHEEFDPKSVEDEIQLADKMEKGDLSAMIVAALGMMVPIAAIILILIIGVAVLLTGMY